MREAGTVVTRERLIDEVWDVNWFGSTKTLDVHVSALRKKLDAALHPHRPRRRLPLRLARGGRVSLRLKLLAAFAYVLVLVLVALEIPLVLSLSSRVDSEVRSQAASQAQVVAAAASARLGDRAQLERVVEQAGRDLGARVIVVGRGRRAARRLGRHRAPQRVVRRPAGDRVRARRTSQQGTRQSETVGDELLFTAVPILDAGRTVGAVRVTQSNEAVSERVRRNVLVVVGVGLAALALGLALAWVLAGSLARPLRALARTARRVEDGELDARAEVTGAREQQEVAIAFNEMTDRLGQALEAQREFVGNASASATRTPLTGLRLRVEAARPEERRRGRAARARARRS